MSHLKNKTALVYDNGLFSALAEQLSKDFGKVYYFTPWKNAYPNFMLSFMGTGLDNGVINIANVWDVYDEVDVWVFPDVYDGDLQEHLKRQGKKVFGSGKAEELELLRWTARDIFEKHKIDTIPAIRVKGISELKQVLKDQENKYIKISTYRGLAETFCHREYFLSEPWLDKLEHTLGPFKEDFYFIVEDECPAIEMGAETFIVDGEYTPIVCAGYEIKDLSYMGRFYNYKDLPERLKDVNDKLKPYLKKTGMRGMFSTEVRMNKKGNYLIDPCMRAGVPPGEVMFETISNWGEIVWAIANGEIPDIKYKGKYMVEIMIDSSWAKENWMPIYVPTDIRDNVKIAYPTKFEDYWYVTPLGYGSSKVGAVVAYDDDLQKAIKKVQEYADKIKGSQLNYDGTSLDQATEVIKEGEKIGIKF